MYEEFDYHSYNQFITPSKEIINDLTNEDKYDLTYEFSAMEDMLDDKHFDKFNIKDITEYSQFIDKVIGKMDDINFNEYIQECLKHCSPKVFTKIANTFLQRLKSEPDNYLSDIYSLRFEFNQLNFYDQKDIIIDKNKLKEDNPQLYEDMLFEEIYTKSQGIYEENVIWNEDNYDVIHSYSDLVINEIMNYFLDDRSHFNKQDLELNHFIQKTKSELNHAFDKEDEIKILKKEYYYYISELNNNNFYIEYFKSFENRDVLSKKEINEDFRTYIKFQLRYSHQLILDFLQNTFTIGDPEIELVKIEPGFSLDNYPLFKNIDHILNSFETISFLKTELSIRTNRIKKPKKNIQREYFNNIFISLEAQNAFYNTLIDCGAINENSVGIPRKFQPICDAIFNKHSKHFDEIFKYRLRKKDYIIFLEENFSTEIKDKSKLSDGTPHQDTVKKLIFRHLQNLS